MFKQKPADKGDKVTDLKTTDKASNKPKEKPKAKEAPKDAKEATQAAAGHNSGIIPEALERVDNMLAIDAKIKELNRAKRDERNVLKTRFGVSSAVLAYELSMRKKNPDVRVQIEAGIKDFKDMLGYEEPEIEEPEYVDPGRELTTETIQREG